MDHFSFVMPFGNAVFWGVITFSILVFIHEGGHFLAARAFGIKVHEFMLGLPGPALRFHTKSGTAFGVTAIPLGGYVRIAGMEPGSEDVLLAPALKAAAAAGRIDSTTLAAELGVPLERASSLLVTLADYMALEPATDDEVSYLSQVTTTPAETPDELLARVRACTYRGLKTWQRVLVLSAGVLVNIVAAILVFTFVLSVFILPHPTLVLSDVVAKTGAAEAGLKPGDAMVAIDGARLASWDELLARLQTAKPGQTVVIVYSRGGVDHTVRAVLGSQDGSAFLGVGPRSVYRRLPVSEAFVQSLQLTAKVFAAVIQFVANVVHPRQFVASLKDARSVIGISEFAAQAASTSALAYAWLVAVLSLSLGAMNIIPLPPLDGGKVAVELTERALGHPLRREVSLAISATGAVLLFTLIGYLMYADIMRPFGH